MFRPMRRITQQPGEDESPEVPKGAKRGTRPPSGTKSAAPYRMPVPDMLARLEAP